MRRVASAHEIPAGTAKPFRVRGHEVLICNVDGEFSAIEDVCTHDGAALDQGELSGHCIVCPRHGATFDVRTGAVLALPAVIPLRTYGLRLDGDDILIDL